MTAATGRGAGLSRRWTGPLGRNLAVILLAAALVAGFLAVHAQWSPMHRWNRAFGDASFLLLALAMAVGATARLWRPAGRVIAFRRELGVYATLLAIVHLVVILAGWVTWDLWRLFGFEFHPQLGRYVMVQHGFGLANAVGLVALALAIPLALTSNDMSVRRLGAQTWKVLQMGAVPLWWLGIAHVGYFLFAHFLSFHRQTPDPNPLQWPFVGLVLAVVTLRLAAFAAATARPPRDLRRAA
ncbi:ferric reductase-like transmembrane domain-containing protein [Salinarimonas rosea]|uniref:ferric reductase-like transmembrane domain-containing protein n=1 Tax=Salinarimonas rosea TaxID=552063 RepID=UPI0006945B15|nr:ferric reductase-like transmembrane domain-containing protein [Salinarimonas rosea]